jgi:hypothetical protein
MSELERIRRERERHQEKPPEPTWADARKLLVLAIIDVDYLAAFAGDGERGFEAPASVRREPRRLLEWCRRYAPEAVVDDEAAFTAAQNRALFEAVGRVRDRNPKMLVRPADVIELLRGDQHA